MTDAPDVLVLHQYPPETPGTLADFGARVRDDLPDAAVHVATDYADAADRIETTDVVVALHLPDDLLDRAGSLDWVHALSAGVNRFDRDRLAEMGALLTSVAGVHAEPVAEQVLSYVLLFERNLRRGLEQQRRGEWRRYPADELTDKTLGVVGVGQIGGRLAAVASAFGMTVVGTKRDVASAPDAVDRIYDPSGLHRVLGAADYVALTCPLTEATRGLLGPAEFTSMGQDAVLVNVARGGVVEQDALVTALQTGEIGGAALDVFETEPLPSDSPLWDMSNVVVTPHMAGGSARYGERAADLFVENYERFAAGNHDAMVNRQL
jgi:phosphoglycerate dehydrogenase-like enzyme